MFLWAQGVGIIGLLVNCGSYLLRTRRQILGLQLVSSALWAIHFGMLDAPTAVAMNLLAVARQAVFFYRGEKRWASSGWWPFAFSCVFAAGTWLTWEGPASLLPCAGMVLGTIALWQVETRRLRLLCMLPPPLWLSYNILHGSLPGIATEIFIFISQLVGFWKHERRRPS